MAQDRTDQIKKPVIKSKSGAFFVVAVFVIILMGLFLVSMLDTDKTVSEKENRTLKSRPKFSLMTMISGEDFREFEEYYQDTFPLRDNFLDINSKISTVFSKMSAGDEELVLVEKQDKDDFAGQNID